MQWTFRLTSDTTQGDQPNAIVYEAETRGHLRRRKTPGSVGRSPVPARPITMANG